MVMTQTWPVHRMKPQANTHMRKARQKQILDIIPLSSVSPEVVTT